MYKKTKKSERRNIVLFVNDFYGSIDSPLSAVNPSYSCRILLLFSLCRHRWNENHNAHNSRHVYQLCQQLLYRLPLFPNLISVQKPKQNINCCHRIQNLKRLISKTTPLLCINLQTVNSAIVKSCTSY